MVKVQCWCGMVIAAGRLHYPGDDPENGPAHAPGEGCPECGGEPHDIGEVTSHWRDGRKVSYEVRRDIPAACVFSDAEEGEVTFRTGSICMSEEIGREALDAARKAEPNATFTLVEVTERILS